MSFNPKRTPTYDEFLHSAPHERLARLRYRLRSGKLAKEAAKRQQVPDNGPKINRNPEPKPGTYHKHKVIDGITFISVYDEKTDELICRYGFGS